MINTYTKTSEYRIDLNIIIILSTAKWIEELNPESIVSSKYNAFKQWSGL